MEYLSDWFNASAATIFWCSLFLLTWAGIFLGAFGFFAGQRWLRHYRQQWRLGRADAEGDQARKILERLGFSVENDYARHTLRIFQDGQPLDLPVRPDLIANKGGKSYVVNVMSEATAGQVADPLTRRQLLEYYVTYKPHGLLLMDMENKRIHDIRFDLFASDF